MVNSRRATPKSLRKLATCHLQDFNEIDMLGPGEFITADYDIVAIDQFEIPLSIRHRRLCHRVVDVGPVVFEVVNIASQLPESDAMVQQLPDDAGKRISHGEVEEDDLPFTLAAHGF